MTAYAEVPDPQAVMARSGKTFHQASRLLPPRLRSDVAALYAFCRYVDDLADEAEQSEDGRLAARRQLESIRRQLQTGISHLPVVAAYLQCTARYKVPLSASLTLLEGVASDLNQQQPASVDHLLRYCYSVAGVVGLLLSRVLTTHTAAEPFAIDLGIAMQLTNIARDVRKDYDQGRIYLPATWIAAGQVGRALAAVNPADQATLETGIEHLLELADRYYRSATDGIRFLPLRVRPAILAAATAYQAIGSVILRNVARSWQQRAVVSTSRKKLILCRSVLALLHPHFWKWTGSPTHLNQLHAPLKAVAETYRTKFA